MGIVKFKLNIMKKRIITSICTSVILYLIVAFVKFDICWISEISDYTDGDRAFALWVYLATQFATQILCNIEFKQNK